MQLKEIPVRLGITARHLAELIGQSPASLNNYLRGRKVKPSEYIARICEVSGIMREEIYFPDVFSHPDGEDRNHAAYWLNIAIEALKEAQKRGLPQHYEEITDSLHQAGLRLVDPGFGPEVFE